MNLADHLRPLLRDHDCVIIPDFGGLVVEYSPARVRPAGRHLIYPPTRQVAFNQALTRNDGLLVDALRQHLGLGAPEAREAVRQAVAGLHQQLRAELRTELPGIGVFKTLPGRGLQFNYTGTDNLLPAAYGLPELTAHPVRTLDARVAREQQAQLGPRLRSASRQVRWGRLVPGAAIGLLAGLAVAAVYLLGLHPEAAPVALRTYLPRFDQVAASRPAPQQATLGQPSFAPPVPTGRPGANADPIAELLAAPSGPAAPSPEAAAPITAPTTTPAATASTTAEWEKPTAPPSAPVAVAKHPAATPRRLAVAALVAAAPRATATTIARPKALAAKRLAIARPAIKAAGAKVTLAWPTAAPARVAGPRALAVGKALGAATTIKRRTGRFYVVVAAYDDLAHAEEGRRRLAKTGRPAKVILPYFGTRHYRLSAADFADRVSASYTAAKLRHNPNFDKASSVLPY